MTEKNFINQCEKKYSEKISHLSEQIAKKPNIRLVLIAGPSCSGKTTTSCLLCSLLKEKHGIISHTISIDDFYKDVVYLPGETVKDKDFEAIESIDLELLHTTLSRLADGKSADIPLFDFEKTKRCGIRSTITLKENEIAIVEGLHALNSVIYENFVPREKIFSIFLDCYDTDEKKDARLVRRLVRDYNFRNADANLTFTLWDNVLRGEEKYIYPFAETADVSVNTFHEYESALLKPYAVKILSQIQTGSEFYKNAESVLEYLSKVKGTVDKKLVPTNSLLREFVG